MHAVNSTSLTSVLATVVPALLWLPMMAQARSEDSSDTGSRNERSALWIPSVAIHTGVTVQNWSGSVDSTLIPGPGAADPTPVPIRPSKTDQNLDVSPVVGLSLELMSPELPVPASPRLVIGAEMVPIFGFERSVARNGDPSTLRPPLPPGSTIRFDEDKFVGQGSKVTSEMDKLAWGAYMGMSFPFELFDRSLRIKPNVSWLRYRLDFTGLVSDAECITPSLISPTDCNAPTSSVRAISLAMDTSKSFHAIGPGIDLEMETSVFGHIGSAIFVGFRAYRVLTDRRVEFGATQTFNDPIGTGDVTNARFSTKVNSWIYRAVFGFRVELQGFLD